MNMDTFYSYKPVPKVKNFSKPGSRRMADRSGFSLIEIALVVVIIGILAALAIPAFQKMRHQANVNKFLNDLRVFSGQFENYHFATAQWPSTNAVGVLPPELEGYIGSGSFAQTNAVGGQWQWYNDSVAGIGVTHGGSTQEHILYQSIAAEIDNGDFFTGRFQLVEPTTLVWILTQP